MKSFSRQSNKALSILCSLNSQCNVSVEAKHCLALDSSLTVHWLYLDKHFL